MALINLPKRLIHATRSEIKMKTVLYTGCYLDGEDALKNNRLERNIRYVNYYSSMKELLGFDNIFMLDNGSSYGNAINFLNQTHGVIFESLENIKSDGPNHYPYCWRALYYIQELIEKGYEKIIMIDSDGFVVSRRLFNHIKNLRLGWNTVWCKRWEFPEASLQILCKDSFHLFKNFARIDYKRRFGNIMEIVLPFTHIFNEFNCDRFGETNAPFTSNIDYYGQAGPDFIPQLIGDKYDWI